MVSTAQSFEFTSYNFDLEKRKADFVYTLTLHDAHTIKFVETISFPKPFSKTDINPDLLYACLYNIHLILGISYWKLYCPTKIILATAPLSEEQAQFWNTVYQKGLGEFFYRNSINFHNLIHFPFQSNAPTQSYKMVLPHKSLIGLGGGKDSIVVIERLKKDESDIAGFIFHSGDSATLAQEVAKIAQIHTIVVERTLDKQLFALNSTGNVYNGHIPISSIYAFVGLFTSILYGYDSFVVGNEKSANIGNVTYLDEMINHQWSKSQEFEMLFTSYVNTYITPSVKYYSPLREESELAVIQEFTKYPNYFHTFSSCNRNFKITKSAQSQWCGTCPKCAFVFSALAAFLPKKEVLSIFKQDLFSNRELIHLYKQLAGIADIKPFECVGTFEETQLALYLCNQKKEYEGSAIMNMFQKEIASKISDINLSYEATGIKK